MRDLPTRGVTAELRSTSYVYLNVLTNAYLATTTSPAQNDVPVPGASGRASLGTEDTGCYAHVYDFSGRSAFLVTTCLFSFVCRWLAPSDDWRYLLVLSRRLTLKSPKVYLVGDGTHTLYSWHTRRRSHACSHPLRSTTLFLDSLEEIEPQTSCSLFGTPTKPKSQPPMGNDR